MNAPTVSSAALFGDAEFQARPLLDNDLPMLQAFFVANPDYFIAVNGVPPRSDEARQEFDERVPAGMAYERQYRLGLFDAQGGLIGVAWLVSILFAAGVWHIGLFIVATALHGSGRAQAMHQALHDWIACQGARWIRLGAVVGNRRAERFWEKLGYLEVRRRTGIQTGLRISTVRVFVKGVGGAGLDEYLQRVERDRPGSA